MLIAHHTIQHAYPHCWRCKHPVIFRSTQQWFISMDTPFGDRPQTLRQRALDAIDRIVWHPKHARNRLYNMIALRPDWCISRQRLWGIPIPAFICNHCHHAAMTGPHNQAIQSLIQQHGSLAWFEQPVSRILDSQWACHQCGKHDFYKETDILDVWFESGASFKIGENHGWPLPMQLYLEGSDQHRGWFQSSLLIGLASMGKSPYEAVLTHGFMVDKNGQKMSKSQKNVTSPQGIIDQYGADILRWFVAGSDVKNHDMSLSRGTVEQARDSFTKVRNTLRFLLSNLNDFSPQDHVYATMSTIDRWILAVLAQWASDVQRCYQDTDFHMVRQKVHEFCAVWLSARYLDMVKDRLYCDAVHAQRRVSTQHALYWIFRTVVKLIAPILVFSADDIWEHAPMSDTEASIHMTEFDQTDDQWHQPALVEQWNQILSVKDHVYRVLEQARLAKTIRSSLEVAVTIHAPDIPECDDWESVLMVSRVTLCYAKDRRIDVVPCPGNKCQRCWKYGSLTHDLCKRCHACVYGTIQP